MIVTHALQLLIKGKSLAGPALKKAGDQLADLSRTTKQTKLGLEQMGEAGAVASTAIGTGATAAGKALAGLGAAGRTVLKALAVGATAAATAVVALVTAFIGLPAVLGAATSKLTDYAAELDLARDAMWAITGDAMPAMTQSLREATAFMTTEKDILREYHMAYMLLGQDLATRVPEAMQYLTKVAALTGDTVEYLTSRLVRSVGRLSTRWMAYIGTVVTVEEAEARAAEMFGLTTDELSYQQKQAGMLDRVLAKLAARTSILPEVMGTTKQMSEALKVSWKELWAEVTTHLLPVASGLYKILLRSVVAWKALVTQGGALYGPIRKVTATFTVLLEILGDLLDKALEVEEGATSALERFADNVISMAWKAVQWGSNIAVNLAIGIVKGASVALIGAMNFISGLLAHWLAPGSAPLVVSNILDWGASAFTEFLRGFSMADFDILESIQGPLKRALSVLVKLDELGEIEAGEYFIELSEMMAEAIATGDPGAVFAKLAEIPGGYGESLAELYRRQMDLGAAVERLAAAEARLAAARKAEEASGVKLSEQAREYNKLAQAGASPEILAAKLAEVKASYAALVAAREETEAAEEAKDAAAEQVKWQKEQVRLQERLLKQLIEMGQAFADLLPKPGDEDDPFVIPPIEWPEGFLVPIDTAFEELKESIRAKFAALFADLKAQWKESGVLWWMAKVKETWEQSGLKEWWDEFWADVKDGGLAYALGELWDKLLEGHPTLQAINDAFKEWWDPLWVDIKDGGLVYALGNLWDKFLEAHPTLKAVNNWLSEVSTTFKAWVADEGWPWVLTQWDKWSAWWDEHGQGIIDWLFGIGDEPYSYKNLWAWVVTEWDKWVAWWEEDGPVITGLIESIGISLDDLLGGWVDWEATWESLWKSAGNVLTFFTEKSLILMEGWMAQLRNYITLAAQILTGDWEGAWETMQEISGTTLDTINELTDGKLLDLMRIMGAGAQDTVDEVRRVFGVHSESSVFRGIGEAVVRGFVNVVRGLPQRASETILAELWRMSNAGHQMMDALRDAIYQKAKDIADALRDVINRAIQAAKDALGIHSKSKVFFEFGQNITSAFAEGIGDLAEKPAAAIEQMAKGFKPRLPIEIPAYAKGFLPPAPVGVTAQSVTEIPKEGYAATPIIIHNHFGRDSIRSDRDVQLIADQIQRALELQGVRSRIA